MIMKHYDQQTKAKAHHTKFTRQSSDYRNEETTVNDCSHSGNEDNIIDQHRKDSL